MDDDTDQDDDMDDDMPEVYFKFKGDSDSMGIVLATTYDAQAPTNPEYWGVVCNDGMGRNEAEAMCKYFGYNTGVCRKTDHLYSKTNALSLSDTASILDNIN